jgi:uncharacterized protein (DUF1330 family)
MYHQNSLLPNEQQMVAFADTDHEGPIYMVNLLKFKPNAQYADGRPTELTGRQAYDIYAASVSQLLQQFGGGAMFKGDVKRLVIGEVEDLWDEVAIAMYPSRQAMMNMMMSPEMQDIAVHRAAGLEGQLNIESVNAAGLWLKDT